MHVLPLITQSSAQTTSPSGSTFWLRGNCRSIVKVTLAPVKVGESFPTLNVTFPPVPKTEMKVSVSIILHSGQ